MNGLGLLLPYRGCPTTEALRLACIAEDVGFDGVWASEAAAADAFALLAAVATRTHRVELGTAVVPLGTRTPALLAMAAQTVQDLSDGRLNLGVGVSSQPIIESWHGLSFAPPVATVRDALAIIAQVFRGGSTEYDGAVFSSSGFKTAHLPASPPPVLLAALGPTMRRVATETADGMILNFLPRSATRLLANAAQASHSRTLALVRVGTACSADLPILQWSVRRELGSYLRVAPYARWVESLGFKEDVARVTAAATSEQRARAVSSRLVEETAVLGSPEYCRERLTDLAEAGIEPIVVPVGAGTGTESIERLLLDLTGHRRGASR